MILDSGKDFFRLKKPIPGFRKGIMNSKKLIPDYKMANCKAKSLSQIVGSMKLNSEMLF